MGKETAKRYAFTPDYAVPPGETLQETIAALGMTQKELALRTGLDKKTINLIIKGKAPITPETAILLEQATGVPARFWNNLESNYREQLARITSEEKLAADEAWLRGLPVKDLIKRGYVAASKDRVELIRSVLAFFGVAGALQWRELYNEPKYAFRQSKAFAAEPGAIVAWLRIGEMEAYKTATRPYSVTGFKAALAKARGLTNDDLEGFLPTLRDLCASAGVALVLVPGIKGCRASGATRWLGGKKALIQLSLRYNTNDHFWFSFFHEAGHILEGSKKEIIVEFGASDAREKKADEFAADFLIPPTHAESLRKLRTRDEIVDFSRSLGIAPGIVVGRLQKEGLLDWNTGLNKLKKKLMPEEQ